MHTINVIGLLKTKEARLKVKIMNAVNKKPSSELVVVKIFGLKLCNAILKNVCNTLWMIRLLKTSIVVTKTPLITLKCLPKAIVSQSLSS